MKTPAILLLENGHHFPGFSFGAPGTAGAEVCFNTSMTGYQRYSASGSGRSAGNQFAGNISSINHGLNTCETGAAFLAAVIRKAVPFIFSC